MQDSRSVFPFNGGDEGLKRLNYYLWESKKVSIKTRNGLIGIDYSSKFSWLSNGSLSPELYLVR